MMSSCGQLGAGSAVDTSGLPTVSSLKDDLKTQFVTREGVYKQMTLSEYSRPNRVAINQAGNNACNAPVRVSFLSIPPTTSCNHGEDTDNDVFVNGDASQLISHGSGVSDFRDGGDSPIQSDPDLLSTPDRMCFNAGRELYVFVYRGIRHAADLSKPIDKRVYKGTYPTSHDFNQQTATPTSCSLIIGFSAGQIQLIDPFQKEYQISRLYNEDRFIDKSAVTHLKWVPGQPQCFLASHFSGNMYLYDSELSVNPGPPVYQVFKQGDGYTVYTCKTKQSRNPMYRWSIGTGAVNQFAFSPDNDAKYLATVSHDGFLRVFNYHAMELIGFMKSYFGGLLCLSWSPDSRYIVTGGEDDLITIYSVLEKRIICRGQGHKSWISQVAFDPYTSYLADNQPSSGVPIDLGSEDDLRPSSLNSSGLLFRGGTSSGYIPHRFSSNLATQYNGLSSEVTVPNVANSASQLSGQSGIATRRGLAGGSVVNLRTCAVGSTLSHGPKSISSMSLGGIGGGTGIGVTYRIGSVGHDTQLCLWDLTDDILRQQSNSQRNRNSTLISVGIDQPFTMLSLNAETSKLSTNKESGLTKEKKLHKRGFSFGAKLAGSANERWGRNNSSALSNEKEKRETTVARLLGTPVCPRMDEVPVIEPLICKKISRERLTGLEFREDCVVTACQEGFILTWARPGKASSNRRSLMSPVAVTNANISGGTVVEPVVYHHTRSYSYEKNIIKINDPFN
ncbi:hypothetical protein AB6A40_004076 [Gnathostoma spinigerum]|uniref:WD_REPEATS_REGION domain-containing protein n=1 Tax=Gnathostoma spinigerum TaxID=75299 RepID=A0ABD6EDM1_9BILA